MKIPTLVDFKKVGYTVDIKHCRDHKVAYVDPLTKKLKVSTVRHVKEFVNTDSADCYMLWELLPKGGRTEITLTDPVSHVEFWANSICRDDDNYDKREGVKQCLERLTGLMMVCDGKEGFTWRLQ